MSTPSLVRWPGELGAVEGAGAFLDDQQLVGAAFEPVVDLAERAAGLQMLERDLLAPEAGIGERPLDDVIGAGR